MKYNTKKAIVKDGRVYVDEECTIEVTDATLFASKEEKKQTGLLFDAGDGPVLLPSSLVQILRDLVTVSAPLAPPYDTAADQELRDNFDTAKKRLDVFFKEE